ncbi:MAG: YIP1 family protein [Pseudomonadota bacterium]
MIAEAVSRLVEGYVSPRASARRMLDSDFGWDTIALLVILGYLISACFAIFVPIEQATTSLIAKHVWGVLNQVLGIALISALAWQLGRWSGGTSTFQQMALVLGWHQVVIAFLSPFLLGLVARMQSTVASIEEQAARGETPPVPDVGGGVVLGGMIAAGYALWLMASFIAEAHGFRSAMGVVGVMLGLPLAFAFLAAGLLGGAG